MVSLMAMITLQVDGGALNRVSLDLSLSHLTKPKFCPCNQVREKEAAVMKANPWTTAKTVA